MSSSRSWSVAAPGRPARRWFTPPHPIFETGVAVFRYQRMVALKQAFRMSMKIQNKYSERSLLVDFVDNFIQTVAPEYIPSKASPKLTVFSEVDSIGTENTVNSTVNLVSQDTNSS